MSEVSSSKKRASKGRRGVLVSVLVMVAVVVFGLTAPPTGAQGYSSIPSCSVTPPSVSPGGTVTVVASGFLPGSTVTFEIERARMSRAPLGQATADETGTATAEVVVPSNLRPGTYTVSCTGIDAEGADVVVASNVSVVDETNGGGGGPDGDGTGSDPGSDDLARTGSNATTLVRIAVLLIAAGGAALLATRKRAQRGAPSV